MNHQIVLGYYNMRGLGQPIRLLLEYIGIKYNDRNYIDDAQPDKRYLEDQQAFGLEDFHLPYLRDDRFTIFDQDPIMLYLSLQYKPELCGHTNQDRVEVEIIKGVVRDLQFLMHKLFYDNEYQIIKDVWAKEQIDPILSILENHLGEKDFISGDLTFNDFQLFQALDVINIWNPNLMEQHENLKNYILRFSDLPRIQQFLQTELIQNMNINNPKFSKFYKKPDLKERKINHESEIVEQKSQESQI